MAANRVSTSLVQFLGAEVSARRTGGKLANVVKGGVGGERFPDASSQRVGISAGASDIEPGSIQISEYESALVYMQRNGAAPLAAKAMAVVMVDTAKAQGVSVMSLFNDTGSQEVALNNNAAYTYINQLRDGSSQLGGSEAINNANSLRARYILA